jgi:hypothetical protein
MLLLAEELAASLAKINSRYAKYPILWFSRCTGYLVYLFKDDETKVRIAGP